MKLILQRLRFLKNRELGLAVNDIVNKITSKP